MSTTYSLGCRQCRKHLWIAQASAGVTSLYTGHDAIVTALKAFLFDHLGHPLVFNENCESEVAEWAEIEPNIVGRRPPNFSAEVFEDQTLGLVQAWNRDKKIWEPSPDETVPRFKKWKTADNDSGVPTGIWSCSVCNWKGLDLPIAEPTESHHRWNSKQGKRCTGSLSVES
jgi:hypothetical protein